MASPGKTLVASVDGAWYPRNTMAQEQPVVPLAPRSRSREGIVSSPRQFSSAVAAFAVLLTGAAAAMFLAGGAEQGNLGVFLLCAGAALILCPPRVAVRPGTWLAAAAFLLCSASALLPARFFHVLMWRQTLAVVPDLPLPGTVSASPVETWFWLAVLFVTVMVGLFTLTQPVRSPSLFWLALGAAGVCGGYAALSIFARLSGWTYPFSGGAAFGFFPNRNHTATLLITGSVLSAGILSVAFRARRWLAADAAVLALTLCVAGLLFFSTSRAGVLFLVVGLIGWMLGLRGGERGRLLAVGAVVGLAGAALLFFSKSDVRDRLIRSIPRPASWTQKAGQAAPAEVGGATGDVTADDRLRIYRDTLRVIRDAPLTGTGLGTFGLVFPLYRQASANSHLILHPESDWLMVAAETGLPALACLAALVAVVLCGWKATRDHPYWPLRWAVLVAAGAAALHGLVDVPAHRAALGWWVLTLAGLALQPGRQEETPASADDRTARRVARGTFALAGLLALGLGTQLVRAEWFGGSNLPPYMAKGEQAAILRTFERGDADAAMEQARAAVKATPLVPPLYYQLGVLLLRFEDTDAEADRAFRLQRLLNPFPPNVPELQATAWLALDPARAASLFTEALDRQEKLPPGSVYREVPSVYLGKLVAEAAAVPLAQERMWPVAIARGPDYVLGWLQGANADLVDAKLRLLAADDSFLNKLDPGQRQRFVALWKGKGNAEALGAFLQMHSTGWE